MVLLLVTSEGRQWVEHYLFFQLGYAYADSLEPEFRLCGPRFEWVIRHPPSFYAKLENTFYAI